MRPFNDHSANPHADRWVIATKQIQHDERGSKLTVARQTAQSLRPFPAMGGCERHRRGGRPPGRRLRPQDRCSPQPWHVAALGISGSLQPMLRRPVEILG